MFRAFISILIASLSWLGCSTPGDNIVGLVKTTPGPSAPGGKPKPTATPGEEQPIRLEKTTIKTKKGQRWELEAETVDWKNDNSQADAETVTWYLLDPKGERTVKVDSKGADVDMQSELVEFTGEVVAQRLGSEEQLVVQRLLYNGKKRMFYGSEGVLWKRKGIELAGQTLTANAELDKVQLRGRVKGKTEGGFPKLGDTEADSDQRTR